MSARDSRQSVPELTAELRSLDQGRVQLLAPSPGLWRDAPPVGSLVRPGDRVGGLEILERVHDLFAPEGAVGVVLPPEESSSAPARVPVEYGALLMTLDPEALGEAFTAQASASAVEIAADGSSALTAPTSGRFYTRPSPDKPPFVEVGQVLERGQTVGLLEVMKTFTRINYDDPKLPFPAKVVAVVAADQDDLGSGAVILRVAPLEPPASEA